MFDVTSRLTDDIEYNGKTLSERLAGRFYTPTQLADELADQMVCAVEAASMTHVAATDPFCGDGRLIIALLTAAAKRPSLARLPWMIELRDREYAAVETAAYRVREMACRFNMNVKLSTFVGDTFAGDLSPRFDLVITNPPWELLKPDSRELRHLSAVAAERYKNELRVASQELNDRFPDARAENAWGGWGTNLARCGWDLCLRIAQARGIVGIILPATIMGDQASTSIRRKAFETGRLIDAATYPSEARLFNRVDQPVVALTMRVGTRPAGTARIRSFAADRLSVSIQTLALTKPAMESKGWRIPIKQSSGADDLFEKFSGLPTLQSLEGERGGDLWLGRELDETRVSDKLISGKKHPFVKGRMISRHSVIENPLLSVRAELCTGFHSAKRPRAVWRDVARATSKRRMIGTIIPEGWVAGNSLHVACYRDGDIIRTMALHAFLSSLVFEAQLRARVTTGHMSLGMVRQGHVPVLDATLIQTISSLAHNVIHTGSTEVEHRMEIAVAKAYGLKREEMSRLLDDFPKLNDSERDSLTNVSSWSE